MSKFSHNIVNSDVFVGACEKVLNAYKTDHKIEEDLTPNQIGKSILESKILVIDDNVRNASNCKWQTISANVNGKFGGLYLRAKGERSSGTIAPIDEKSLIEMNKNRKPEFGMLKAREYNPSINITKYAMWVETNEQGIPIKGLPDDSYLSSTYKALWYLQCAKNAYLEDKMDKGLIVQNSKQAKSPSAIIAKSTRIADTVQTHVSDDAKKNAGIELANPIARVTIPFDKTTGMPARGVKFYDKTKPFGKGFEELKFDGDSVTSQNVHKIASGSIIDGIIQADAICYSQMAISVPLNWKLMVVNPPVQNSIDLDDLLDEDDAGTIENEKTVLTNVVEKKTDGKLNNNDVDDIIGGLE